MRVAGAASLVVYVVRRKIVVWTLNYMKPFFFPTNLLLYLQDLFYICGFVKNKWPILTLQIILTISSAIK